MLATLLHDEGTDAPLCISIHPQTPLSIDEHHQYNQMDETQQYLFNQSRIKNYYYHLDHQHSVIALSDEQAHIVEYYEYNAYGMITKEEHTKDNEGKAIQTLNPYRYTGREYDSEDLYYYRARYYDPTQRRFITPDPIGFMGGDTNLYRYVGNDPVNFMDPSGLMLAQVGLSVLEGLAGASDSLTMGASSKIAEVINAKIYGASIAQATTAQIANSSAAQVGGMLADVVTLPKTAVKKLAQTGAKTLAKKESKVAIKKSAEKPGKDGMKVAGSKPPPKKYSRNKAERRKALLRDAKDPDSGLTQEERDFIIKNDGNKVPEGLEVSHEEPLYTAKTIDRKKELDVADNMKTQDKVIHRDRHKICGDQYHLYPK